MSCPWPASWIAHPAAPATEFAVVNFRRKDDPTGRCDGSFLVGRYRNAADERREYAYGDGTRILVGKSYSSDYYYLTSNTYLASNMR